MASFPGWMKVIDQRVEHGELVLTFKIRRWHPGWWLEVARIVWRVLRESPTCR